MKTKQKPKQKLEQKLCPECEGTGYVCAWCGRPLKQRSGCIHVVQILAGQRVVKTQTSRSQCPRCNGSGLYGSWGKQESTRLTSSHRKVTIGKYLTVSVKADEV